MANKMKLCHYELLEAIYDRQDSEYKAQISRCHKSVLKTCIKNGWVKENEDNTVEVTELGMEVAKEEWTELKKFEFTSSMGRTY